MGEILIRSAGNCLAIIGIVSVYVGQSFGLTQLERNTEDPLTGHSSLKSTTLLPHPPFQFLSLQRFCANSTPAVKKEKVNFNLKDIFVGQNSSKNVPTRASEF